MISPKRSILLLAIAAATAYAVNSSFRPAPAAAACKAGQGKLIRADVALGLGRRRLGTEEALRARENSECSKWSSLR